jgi:hypothetical protein
VTSSRNIRNDEFINPFSAKEDVKLKSGKVEVRSSYNQKEWLSSINASFNAMKGSNVGKGTIFYHSGSATFRDNSSGYEKVKLNINHKGIMGTWKLK